MAEDPFTVRRVSEDARGSIYEFTPAPDTHLNLLTLNKGLARGGHSHKYPESFFILAGLVEYHSGTVEKDNKAVFAEGEVIRTTPGEAHYLIALEDTVFVECRPTHTEYQAEDYPPFRALVLQLMRRQNKHEQLRSIVLAELDELAGDFVPFTQTQTGPAYDVESRLSKRWSRGGSFRPLTAIFFYLRRQMSGGR